MSTYTNSIRLFLLLVISSPLVAQLNPTDNDNDGMSEQWELQYGFSDSDRRDAFADPDGDHILNLQEYILRTDPLVSDEVDIYEYDPSTPISTVYAQLRQTTSRRVIVRIPQGDYDFSYAAFFNNDHKVMIQGGWNDDFSDYDPCRYKTILSSSEDFVFGIGGVTDHAGVVVDGFDISCPTGFSTVHLVSDRHDMDIHIHNCNFFDNFNFGLNVTARYEDQHAEVTISNCLFYNNSEGGAVFAGDTQATLDIRVINCTFENPGGEWGDISFSRFQATNKINLDITNSIISDNGTNGGLFQAFQFENIYKVNVDNSFFTPPLQPFDINETNPITTPPVYVDAQNGDFELVASSPLVDAGVDMGLDYVGVARDLGAMESKACDCTIDIHCTFHPESAENANDGKAVVEIQDGLGPFSILWSDGSTLDSIENLAPGKYSVTVTDSDGCTAICCQDIKVFEARDLLADTDDDSLPDLWEEENGMDLNNKEDAFCDNDNDQILNLFEYQLGTDPNDFNDPPKYQITPTMSETDIKALLNLSTNQVIYLRMAEGSYPLSFSDADAGGATATEGYRMILQGGWNSDFSEYDPFTFTTELIPSATNDHIFSLKADAASQIDTTALILDGFHLRRGRSDGAIEVEVFDGFAYNSFNNCAFYENTVAYASVAADSVDYDLWFINSVIHQNNPVRGVIRLMNDEMAISRLSMYNMTVIRNDDLGIYVQQPSADAYMRVDLQNTILWGSSMVQTPTAMFFDQAAGTIDMTNDNLVHNGFFMGGNALYTFVEGTIFSNFVSPGVNNNEAYAELRANSRYKRLGIDLGLPYAADIPDIGFNKGLRFDPSEVDFAFTDALCGSWSGTITFTYPGDENLEYSIDGENWSDEMVFSGLNNGTYSLYVRQNGCAIYIGDADVDDDFSDCGKDTDKDGMRDEYELIHGFDPDDPTDALADADCDAILNIFEYMLLTDPHDDSDPVRVPFRPGQTIQEFSDHIVRSQHEVVLLQLHEGDYDLEFYTEEYWNGPKIPGWDDHTVKRLMIQGGWNSDYTEYNPFCYRTKVNYDDDFLNFKLNYADSIAIICDGLEISTNSSGLGNHAFYGWNFGKVVQYGFNNCSITGGYTGIEFRLDVNAGPLDFFFINSTIADHVVNLDLTLPNGQPHLNFNFINSTLTNSNSDEKGMFELQKVGTDSTNIRFTNCIVWDTLHQHSTNIFPDKNIYLDVVNSVFKGGNGNEYASYTTVQSQDIDPQLVFVDGHYLLPDNSPLRGGGVLTGVPYDLSVGAPHIGVNPFVTRVHDVLVEDTYCNAADGWVRAEVCSPMDMEYKLDTFPWKSTPFFSGLEAGDYVLEMRSVNCSENFSVPVSVINQNSDLQISCMGDDEMASVEVMGGVAPYTYLWDDPAQSITQSVTGLTPGTYTVVVTDDTGCTATCSHMIMGSDCDPLLEDSDNDGMPNDWEVANGLDPCDPTDAFGDLDCDQVWNLYEFQLESDPYDSLSPQTIYVTPDMTRQRIQSLINPINDDLGLRFVMEEGIYDDFEFDFDDFNRIPDRVMVQGGWSECFTEYDPYVYRTIFLDQTTWQDDLKATVIYDGIEMNGSCVNMSITDKTSFSNCAFYDFLDQVAVSPIYVNTSLNNVEFYVINCHLVEQNRQIILNHNGNWNAKIHLINTTITAPSPVAPNGIMAIPRNNSGVIDMYVVDCNMWDNNMNSIAMGSWFTTGGEINVYAINSNLSRTNRVGATGVTDLDADCTDIDPLFDNRTAPYYELSPNSPLTSLSKDNGLYEDGIAANIGYNANVVSCYQGPLPLTVTAQLSDVDCSQSGIPEGSIDLTVQGGVAPYDFIWSSSDGIVEEFSEDQVQLAGGVYNVTVTDAARCSATASYTILSYSEVDFTIGGVNPSCVEDDGQITALPPGDISDFSYAINGNDFQDLNVFENLGPDEYVISFRLKADTNCVIQDSLVLNVDTNIDLLLVGLEATSCGKSNGRVELQVQDADGNVGYFYEGAALQSDSIFTDLASGDYTFYVEDGMGCQDSVQVLIPSSSGISFLGNDVTQPTCGLDNGIITLQYNDPGSVTEVTLNGQPGNLTINSNLASGSYNIQVADGNGCTDTLDLDLMSSEPVEIITIDSIATTCDQDNGAVIVSDVVGNPTEYSIDGINYVMTDTISGLSPDDYLLYVQNDNCADTIGFSIAESIEPELQIAAFDGTDCGEMNGSVDLDVIIGNGPFAYELDSLSNNDGVFESLPAGEYVAYVQDFADCQDSTDVSIDSSEAVVLTGLVTEGLCGELGSIQLVASFGTDDNIYSEEDGAIGSNSVYGNLEGGEYIFYVRTAEDCLDTLIIDVPVYGIPQIEVVDQLLAYCEEPVGSVTVSGSEGKGELTYMFEGMEQSDETTFNGLSAGTYAIVVSDETGCTSEKIVEIEATPRVRVEDLAAEQLFCGDVLSFVDFTPVGGTGDLSYVLTDSDGDEINETDGLAEGRYTLAVVDELGCEKREFIVVRKEECQIYIPTAFSPSSDGERMFSLGAPIESEFEIETFSIYDRWGNLIYNESDIDPLTFTDWWDGTFRGNRVEQGVYVYYIKLGGEKSELITGTVTLLW